MSLAMRIVRICSEAETREMRFSELKSMLLARNYRSGMIDAALKKPGPFLGRKPLNVWSKLQI